MLYHCCPAFIAVQHLSLFATHLSIFPTHIDQICLFPCDDLKLEMWNEEKLSCVEVPKFLSRFNCMLLFSTVCFQFLSRTEYMSIGRREGSLGAGAVQCEGFRRSTGFSWAATGRLQGVARSALWVWPTPTLSCLASPVNSSGREPALIASAQLPEKIVGWEKSAHCLGLKPWV